MTALISNPPLTEGDAELPDPPVRRRSRRGALRPLLRTGTLVLVGWAVALVFFFPVLWMFVSGFKQEAQAATNPPTFFFEPTLDQFEAILGRDFLPFLLNSLMASLGSTVLVIILGTLAAYALSLRPIPGWRDSLFFFLSTRFMPPAAIILPLYVLANNVGVLDNITMLTLIYTAMNLPIAVWMIRSFMMELPKGVLEAAKVDGAPFLTEIRKIILPMIAPGLAATALICFIFAWNEFFFAVSMTSTQAATVPVFLTGFITSEGLFLARLSAAATMAAFPVILAGWIAQKWLVRGLTMGAVK
ncbi:carbohydrate ABC transporter permease [Glycomyces sp. TRM65418]|uniref:carbohydrate ABC transporter permease n=1 Tax=Glycomyces sp. TRM65418 TaxID=2867006 RepID=UPI001CE63553|nr:carbohydrate ABC transporter permease [Glycomyces sp. TRM65418]MCC3764502.1 carbohydrate ABC transporter permease [Glycomyces sp. TRM65418]QZD54172.1 carbohydrate ABC transporter permease [Glycomyces sp. TRM65418]